MISNEEFNRAWQDEENKKVANRAIMPYSKLIRHDELRQAQRIGLWKALEKYDPERENASKFTTFLYYNIKWECGNILKESKPWMLLGSGSNVLSKGRELESVETKEFIQSLNTTTANMMLDRMENKTLREIAQERGVSAETVRRKIDDGVAHLAGLAATN